MPLHFLATNVVKLFMCVIEKEHNGVWQEIHVYLCHQQVKGQWCFLSKDVTWWKVMAACHWVYDKCHLWADCIETVIEYESYIIFYVSTCFLKWNCLFVHLDQWCTGVIRLTRVLTTLLKVTGAFNGQDKDGKPRRWAWSEQVCVEFDTFTIQCSDTVGWATGMASDM